MFIKLGIIAGILILGGMIFSNEIDTLFPSTSANVVSSLKEDVSNFGEKATDSVEKRIDDSIDKITQVGDQFIIVKFNKFIPLKVAILILRHIANQRIT